MPANEPQLLVSNDNYPPELGRVALDLIARSAFWLRLPFTFATADAAALYTVPTGLRMHCQRVVWEITTSMTGGTTPAIGVSSDDANYNTKGDLLGGASGDVTATLVSTGLTIKKGTIGAKYGGTANNPEIVMLASGKIVRFDRIADAFTAGAGNVHIFASFIPAV